MPTRALPDRPVRQPSRAPSGVRPRLTSPVPPADHPPAMTLPKRSVCAPLILLGMTLIGCGVEESLRPVYQLQGSTAPDGWSQWGRAAGHDGQVSTTAQKPARILDSVAFDPFIPAEKAEGAGDVLIHYQSPLVDGDDLFMEIKSGTYPACDPPGSGKPAPCGAGGWDQQVWNEAAYTWEKGALVEKWRFASDWKPEPDAGGLAGWEPVFHAALAGEYVVVPGLGGSVFVVRRADGAQIDRVAPFHADDGSLDPSVHVAGPLTVGPDGSVYYNALALDPTNPWTTAVRGAWLVKIAPDGTTKTVPFADLVPAAPTQCTGRFSPLELPWPPAPDARPAQFACGPQRPGLNVAPAVAPDGTVYTVSRGHFASRAAYLVAVGPDLAPRWAASLAGHLDDGCGSALLPPSGQPGGCREGAKAGVDPATNEPPAGAIDDLSTASPVVAPDGTILYGAYTRYNYSRGHLFQFSGEGSFLAAYDFGWDVTPAIYGHDGTYSIVIKDNRYDVGSYCGSATLCPAAPGGPFRITQLDAHLQPEWWYTNQNPLSCTLGPDGTQSCVSDHPHGFEWCINAPAIDAQGTVYANGEDGVLYAIPQGGGKAQAIFLRQSIGAAYTPLSIDAKGRVYAENFGSLYVVGE